MCVFVGGGVIRGNTVNPHTVPSGGNVTCIEGSRQCGNRISVRQLCRILSSLSRASIHLRQSDLIHVQTEISNNEKLVGC